MKQSSIEWFFEQLEFNDSVSRYELLEQAKQMHKQEIENVYWDCLGDSITSEKFEIYYKNTYEKEN